MIQCWTTKKWVQNKRSQMSKFPETEKPYCRGRGRNMESTIKTLHLWLRREKVPVTCSASLLGPVMGQRELLLQQWVPGCVSPQWSVKHSTKRKSTGAKSEHGHKCVKVSHMFCILGYLLSPACSGWVQTCPPRQSPGLASSLPCEWRDHVCAWLTVRSSTGADSISYKKGRHKHNFNDAIKS